MYSSAPNDGTTWDLLDFATKEAELSRRVGEGSITPEQYKAQLKELEDAHAKETKATDAQTKMLGAQAKANDALKKSTDLLDAQLKKTTGNDFKHLDLAIDATTQSLLGFQTSMASFGGGAGFAGAMGGGFTGAVTGAHFTEYGPAVAGDQP